MQNTTKDITVLVTMSLRSCASGRCQSCCDERDNDIAVGEEIVLHDRAARKIPSAVRGMVVGNSVLRFVEERVTDAPKE